MSNLRELEWFDVEWATSVRDSARKLVCAYTEAYEAIESYPRFVQFVEFSGLVPRPRLLVFKGLLRNAATTHFEIMLRHTAILSLRAFRASRPTAEDLRFLSSRHPTAEERNRAAQALQAFREKQAVVASLLEEAATDVQQLHERMAGDDKPGAILFKKIVGIVRRFLPVAWAWWAAILIHRLTPGSHLQMWGIGIGIMVVYHALGLIGVPFHDAAERKHVYFDGYTGKASDDLGPFQPEMSRFEKQLFSRFKRKPPLVMLWDQVVPLLHYLVAGGLAIYIALSFPADNKTRVYLCLFATGLNWVYVTRLREWWTLLRMRNTGHSVCDIFMALISASQLLDQEKEEASNGES